MNETERPETTANATIAKFGGPASQIGATAHWVVLLRPAQITLGSLVVAARSSATAFGALVPEAHADLAVATRRVEAMLRAAVDYQHINWLMLMMVDPHVHFHVLPRYEGERHLAGLSLPDAAWPGAPDLKAAIRPAPEQSERLRAALAGYWAETA